MIRIMLRPLFPCPGGDGIDGVHPGLEILPAVAEQVQGNRFT
jgi:hypothetical protein